MLAFSAAPYTNAMQPLSQPCVISQQQQFRCARKKQDAGRQRRSLLRRSGREALSFSPLSYRRGPIAALAAVTCLLFRAGDAHRRKAQHFPTLADPDPAAPVLLTRAAFPPSSVNRRPGLSYGFSRGICKLVPGQPNIRQPCYGIGGKSEHGVLCSLSQKKELLLVALLSA
jgi:hypothetical protein